MKTLILIRHAKSSYFEGYHHDIDRPLEERGNADAELMREVLKTEKLKIDKIISSPAIRAIATALIFARGLKVKYEQIEINKWLYEHGHTKLLEVIRSQSDEINHLMMVGHNPDFEMLVRSLVKGSVDKFSTSAAAVIYFNVKRWNDIKQENEILFKLFLPEQFR